MHVSPEHGMADSGSTCDMLRSSWHVYDTGVACWSGGRTSAALHFVSLNSRPTFFAAAFYSKIILLNYSGARVASNVSPAHAT